jgi:hypothetical protein
MNGTHLVHSNLRNRCGRLLRVSSVLGDNQPDGLVGGLIHICKSLVNVFHQKNGSVVKLDNSAIP